MERVEVVVRDMEIPHPLPAAAGKDRERPCSVLGAERREIKSIWKRRQLFQGSRFTDDTVKRC